MTTASIRVDCFHAKLLAEDKIQDAREDTDAHHHFGSPGRTYAQKYRDFTDRDPLVPVSTFDNESTTTSTVTLGAAVPEAWHRLPLFIIIPVIHNNFSLSFCTQVCPVIRFLVMFPEDVLHIIVDLRDNNALFLLRHECNVF